MARFRGPHRIWTREEVHKLIYEWGLKDLEALGTMLGRTAQAIAERARKLKLGPPARSSKTMNQVARESGYSLSRLWNAVELLRLDIRRRRRMDPRQPRRTHHFDVSVDQEVAILNFLRKQPDGLRLFGTTKGKTRNGVWGIGKKPPACLRCRTKKRPHCARGLCDNCYAWQRRRRRSVVREDCRADAG